MGLTQSLIKNKLFIIVFFCVIGIYLSYVVFIKDGNDERFNGNHCLINFKVHEKFSLFTM